MGDDTTTTENEGRIPWHGVLAPVGVLSGDNRRFAKGGITNRDLPLPMQWVEAATFGHDGAVVVGSIETITYGDDDLIHFTGWRGSDENAEKAAGLIEDGSLRGVSVDLDQVVIEYVNEDGSEFDPYEWMPGDPEPVMEVREGRIAAATIVAIPAFQEAWIALGEPGGEKPEHDEPLVAAAAPAFQMAAEPVTYNADWFLDPEFTQPTPLTVTEDGRVFGHVATWGTCHLGFGKCVTAPHSSTKYAYFLLKEVLTDQGALPVGAITLDTGHAALDKKAGPALAHYDETGTVAAFINVGEDAHGIWFAGSIKAGLSAERVAELRGAVLSGDWRPTPYGREFVAALAVNVPGFPVPRVAFSQTSVGEGALVAASPLRPRKVGHGLAGAVDYDRLAAKVVDEIEARQAKRDARSESLSRLRSTATETFGEARAPEPSARETGLKRLREAYNDVEE